MQNHCQLAIFLKIISIFSPILLRMKLLDTRLVNNFVLIEILSHLLER